MRLWYMDSKVLQGFYKSEVYAVGANKNDAIQTALQAYDHWVADQLAEYGFHRLISDSFPDDEQHIEQSRLKREEFHRELQSDFKQLKYRGQIDVSS